MKSINLQNGGISESSASSIALLLGQFDNVEAIDLSDNEALGTSGAARLLEVVGRGVKSVNLKKTGLGLTAGGELVAPPGVVLDSSSSSTPPEREVCSDEHWTRLEGALRGLTALEAIDLSDNEELGTSGAARLLEVVGRGVKSVSLKKTGLRLAAGQERLLIGAASHTPVAMPPFRDPGSFRDTHSMTESELRAELSYSSRPPRCCEFDAAWRARSAPRSYMMQEQIRKESPGLGS